jgi:hypothetical protein
LVRSLLHRFSLFVILLVFAAPVYADGPEPAFFVYVGVGAFCIAQAWIVTSEFIYLVFLFKGLSKFRILWWAVLINLVSAVVGIVPLIVFMLIGESGKNLFGRLAIFIGVTYPITVVVESRLLYHLSRGSSDRRMRNLVAHSFGFNAVSYSGLLLLLAWLYK